MSMKVELLTSRAGLEIVQQAGDVVDVSDDEAVRLLERNEAVPVRHDDGETAVARPAETTAKGATARRHGRPRTAGKQPPKPPSTAPTDEPPPEPTR